MGPMPAQLSLPHAVLTDADSDADSADSFHIAPSSSAPAPPRRPASWLAGPLLIPASPAVAGQAVVEHAVLEETQAMCCSSSERSASGGSSSGGSSRSTSAARARPVARTAWPDKRPLLAPPSKAAACCDSGSGTLLPAQALACHQAAAYITRDGERCSRISRQAGRTLRQAEEDARRRVRGVWWVGGEGGRGPGGEGGGLALPVTACLGEGWHVSTCCI